MKRSKKKKSRKIETVTYTWCPNCGKQGPHFVPPSFGEDGFFICEPSSQSGEMKNEII